MSTPSVKGTLLLAAMKYLQSEASAGAAPAARRLLAEQSGQEAVLGSRWYPCELLRALEQVAAKNPSPGVPFTSRGLGAFYAKELLQNTYANLKKDTPAAMAGAVPILFSCIYTDIRLRFRPDGTEAAAFTVEGLGLRVGDLETHAGVVEGAFALAGADRTEFVPGGVQADGSISFKILWGTASHPATEKVMVRGEFDIMSARERARQVARGMGFGIVDVVGITTCASELARNIFTYAGEGTMSIEDTSQNGGRCIRIVASDQGPGIVDLDRVLSGDHKSERGMGMGLCAIRRLADEFNVDTSPGVGTSVEMVKYLRRR